MAEQRDDGIRAARRRLAYLVIGVVVVLLLVDAVLPTFDLNPLILIPLLAFVAGLLDVKVVLR